MPQGYDNMFFALFGITNRAVSLPFTATSKRTNSVHLVLDNRPERHPSHHQRYTKQLDGVSVPIFYLYCCHDHDQFCRCGERP